MKLDKIIKVLGKEAMGEFDTASKEDLMLQVVKSEAAKRDVSDELENNSQYQDLKEGLKAISSGKREVYTRQNAIVAYCLHLLDQG